MKVLTTYENFNDAGLRSFPLIIFLHFNILVFQHYFQFVLYSANMLNLFCNICIVSELSLYLFQMLLIKIKNICMDLKIYYYCNTMNALFELFSQRAPIHIQKNILDDIIFSERKTHFFYCKQQRIDLLTISR